MRVCADRSSQIQLYLDNELTGSDLEEFLAHLEYCASCQNVMEEAETFSRRLAQARPFAVAPAALRERIANLAATQAALNPEMPLHESKVLVMSSRKKTIRYALALAAMLFLVVGGLLLVPRLRVESNSNSFVATAIDSNRALSDAALQLDVQSESPSVVSAWFSQRVSFPFRMPDAGIAANDLAKYKLRGGRLVTFGGERAAVLVFQLSQNLVTVLIAPDRHARAVGGNVTYSDGIKFHALDRDRMHVVTWENKNLTYALTSNITGSRARACSTCHEGASPEVVTSRSQSIRWMLEARSLQDLQHTDAYAKVPQQLNN
jgi:anti-sigma factor RsiW